MSSRIGTFLIVVILVLLTLSCAKVGSVSEEGDLATEALPSIDSIPSKYGNLVSVSNVTRYPDWVQLWFQDENGNLSMVRYSVHETRFAKEVKLIPRK